jgi:hypothetical protein
MPRKKSNVLRVAAGMPDAVFAPPWRFWTSGRSAYFSQRSSGSAFKASFHPADERHESAVWTAAFTAESGVVMDDVGSRRSHTWEVPTPSPTGLYLGPAISIPRLEDRLYDLPPTGRDVEDLSDMHWIDAPEAGSVRFLHVVLSDDRPDIEYQLDHGESLVGTLAMTTGWHASVLTWERPLRDHERAIVEKTRDEMDIGISPRPPQPGTESGAIIWVTTSPADGRPLFVQIVLGSENYHLESGSASSAVGDRQRN